MTKILYLLNFVGKGGTEKYVLDLIHAVGPENCVFIYSEEGPGLEDFIRAKVKMYQVNMNGPFDFNAAKQIKRIIQAEKVEVVHAQFLRENYLAILAKITGARCKVIWTYHVDVPMGKAIRSLNKMMTSFNHKVITVSHFMHQQLAKKGVSMNKLTLIYNGVEGPADSHPLTSLREVPVITVVGRLREEKGQDFLINSLADLRSQHPSLKWECHIYGEGPQQEELVSLVQHLNLRDFVQFKGFSTNKEMLYLNSDIVVVPSSNEALSYVAMEALSYSRVVVATNVGGLPEVIKPGETGELVEYGNREELANVLHSVLTNHELVQKLSRYGRKYFDEHFTLVKMIEETTAIYKH
ncbi:N-acetyl-alpha-D-glucosaminyl L-malate synthase [Neobacillus rhizosphaerae]|uniref:N-acetyl-alpha-D-glucosaminyl L-malate synthase n=1 Tax=Neobacillus rhizosphaerae TaxID=2880965 RepID=A0ABM9EW30_9BACI|nr:glycosyltransferase family 4 protein [Neobacillus rhizosphaerae]CAH2716885.1 N-acetyl-alpha-D-glucosaminyl L-malate synthase [Neobacillus rhizosphaerae]